MKILVCGDRNWKNSELILSKLIQYKPTLVIEGEARGADIMARHSAYKLNIPVERHPALWNKYGKRAGPIRNLVMLDRKPDLVLAFHDDLSNSKGTAHTVREAKRRGIPVEVITNEN